MTVKTPKTKKIAKPKKPPARPKTVIGWEEWCAMPALGLPAIKAKIDTGARTSAIHAFNIKPFKRDGENWVEFDINPLQANKKLIVRCSAPLVDRRDVTSSNGEREKRYVIRTPIVFPEKTVLAEITLTSRHKMTFRMLLGREALRRGRFLVDPVKACVLGKPKNILDMYQSGDSNAPGTGVK